MLGFVTLIHLQVIFSYLCMDSLTLIKSLSIDSGMKWNPRLDPIKSLSIDSGMKWNPRLDPIKSLSIDIIDLTLDSLHSYLTLDSLHSYLTLDSLFSL
jgi:hypothetical protein